MDYAVKMLGLNLVIKWLIYREVINNDNF
jgi:hypothetical protein